VLSSLLKNYKKFLIPKEKDRTSELAINLFDKKEFLNETSPDSKELIKLLLKSQMFSCFIQDNLAREDESEFDKKVYQKLDKWAQKMTALAAKPLAGEMYKMGHKTKNWKKRYFKIEAKELKYYQHKKGSADEKDLKLKGSIELISNNTAVEIPQDNIKAKYPTQYPFTIKTPSQILYCCADNSKQRRQWIKGIRARIKSHLPPPKPKLDMQTLEKIEKKRQTLKLRLGTINKYCVDAAAIAALGSEKEIQEFRQRVNLKLQQLERDLGKEDELSLLI